MAKLVVFSLPLNRRISEGLFTRAGMTQNQRHHQKSHHSPGADPKISLLTTSAQDS